MDFRKIKAGMRVKYRSSNYITEKYGTVLCCYYKDGFKYFDIQFDDEDYISGAWCRIDRDRLDFSLEEYKEDFDKILKRKK